MEFVLSKDSGVISCVNQETFACLALSLIPGLGRKKIQWLIESFGTPSRILAAPRESLQAFGLDFPAIASMVAGRALEEAEREAVRARRAGVEIISVYDERFPPLLKEIDDLPITLYCLGDVTALGGPSVAVVGSRKCSVYGREVSRKFSLELGRNGLTIVSGLARGIDSAAHLAAVEVNGRTIGVLGNGVDVIYPRENRRLFSRVRESGCLISEFPLGAYPAPHNFPVRNRLISGLCHGTVITEASEFSGSLITARLSLEQNREVWAIPGNITSPGSYGPNYLIRQGARPALSPQDVLEDLPPQVLMGLKKRAERDQALDASHPENRSRHLQLNDWEKKILKLLAVDSALHIDWIVERIEIKPESLIAILLDLELKGLIRQLPGKRFARMLS